MKLRNWVLKKADCHRPSYPHRLPLFSDTQSRSLVPHTTAHTFSPSLGQSLELCLLSSIHSPGCGQPLPVQAPGSSILRTMSSLVSGYVCIQKRSCARRSNLLHLPPLCGRCFHMGFLSELGERKAHWVWSHSLGDAILEPCAQSRVKTLGQRYSLPSC